MAGSPAPSRVRPFGPGHARARETHALAGEAPPLGVRPLHLRGGAPAGPAPGIPPPEASPGSPGARTLPRVRESRAPAECPVERLLLLHGAPHVPPGAVPRSVRGAAMRAEAVDFAERRGLARLVVEHREAARAELPDLGGGGSVSASTSGPPVRPPAVRSGPGGAPPGQGEKTMRSTTQDRATRIRRARARPRTGRRARAPGGATAYMHLPALEPRLDRVGSPDRAELKHGMW